jgi:dTDP-4-amino-4,6-dideoxygalactose transaminase
MTNVEAAFIYDQLTDLENILSNKRKIFEKYTTLMEPLVQSSNIALFKNEPDTEPANWIFSLRIIDNKKTIDETTAIFNQNGVDIRPFFYPINAQEHLKEIVVANDSVSILLNKEVIMIPSSPEITIEEQQKVVDAINRYVSL